MNLYYYWVLFKVKLKNKKKAMAKINFTKEHFSQEYAY